MKNIFLILFLYSISASAQNNYSNVNNDSIYINGKIPFTTTKKIAENYFGKNFKIEIYKPGCG